MINTPTMMLFQSATDVLENSNTQEETKSQMPSKMLTPLNQVFRSGSKNRMAARTSTTMPTMTLFHSARV